MTQNELNRAVARATGETVRTIAEMGFVPLTPLTAEREAQTVDWDELEAHHGATSPKPRARELVEV